MTCSLWPKIRTKNSRGGVLPEKLGGGMQHASWNPYPISDQNLWFSLPYFRPNQKFDTRPEALEPGMWPERMTSCYGTYTVVGVNIKREMVLSPNDEQVANSSKKHTQFKTRRHKPYPVSNQNGQNWYAISNQSGLKKIPFWCGTYLYSLYKRLPPGRKMRCRLWVSLLTRARLINITQKNINERIVPIDKTQNGKTL